MTGAVVKSGGTFRRLPGVALVETIAACAEFVYVVNIGGFAQLQVREGTMIDLSTAGIIAKLVGDAVGAIDKIYRGYADFNKMKYKSDSIERPPDLNYLDSPDQKAFVAKSLRTGDVFQKVSYDDLCKKLTGQDLEYIETLTRAMENYEKQWLSVYEQRSMAAGLELARLDTQLDYLAKQIADPLKRVLEFIEKMGLWLSDHYLRARDIANEYLEEKKKPQA